ncbi:hypothetical protein [Methylobacterium sp. A54F]
MNPSKDARPSLREFDAYTDRNGQDLGEDSPLDVGRPEAMKRAREEDPSWQAETARVASDFQRVDAVQGGSVASVEATEAETPPENLRHISDASTTPKG